MWTTARRHGDVVTLQLPMPVILFVPSSLSTVDGAILFVARMCMRSGGVLLSVGRAILRRMVGVCCLSLSYPFHVLRSYSICRGIFLLHLSSPKNSLLVAAMNERRACFARGRASGDLRAFSSSSPVRCSSCSHSWFVLGYLRK